MHQISCQVKPQKHKIMIEKIVETYEALNAELLTETPVNNVVTRKRIKTKLETELPNCEVICDETNNTPMLIDNCVAIARLSWLSGAMELKYVDMIFGNPEQIMKIRDQL